MKTEEFVFPIISGLWAKVLRRWNETEIQGVKVFKRNDVFLAGKAADAFSYLTVNKGLDVLYVNLKNTLDFLSGHEVQTWGIFYFLRALDRLSTNKSLDRSVGTETMETLRRKLDWRSFASEQFYELYPGYPTNYLGCAFGIAKYRERLGWDTPGASDAFLNKIIGHCVKYSGEEYMFCDEGGGEGRFDRYSFLLPAELATRLWETDTPVPAELTNMVRKSCEMALMLSNEEGCGFGYGRSLGAYGDTAILEILAIGHRLGLLSSDEERLAFLYSKRIGDRFKKFWYREGWKMFDLWERGRRGDTYLSKDRVLGDNLSISMHLLRTSSMWNDYEPDTDGKTIRELPKYVGTCRQRRDLRVCGKWRNHFGKEGG